MHTLPSKVPEVTVIEHENKTYYLHKNAHATIKVYQKSQLQSTKTRLTTFTRMHMLPSNVPEVTVIEHENKTYYFHKNAHATIKCTRSHSYRARKQDLLPSQECTPYYQMYQKSQLHM